MSIKKRGTTLRATAGIFARVEIEKIIQTMDELPIELMLKSDGTALLGRRNLQEMMDREAAATA